MAQIDDARKSTLAGQAINVTTWGDLFILMRTWQAEQFPETTAGSASRHLLKEAKELIEKPSDLEEWADAMFLVVQGATKSSPNNGVFFDMVRHKLVKNIWREWQEPDADNVVEHVRVETAGDADSRRSND